MYARTASSTQQQKPPSGVEGDVEVPNPPSDSVSCLAFSPQAELLAAGSWDNKVRIYEVSPTGQAQGKAMYEHQAPVLGLCWNKTGDHVYSAGADNAARSFDLATGQSSQVAQHDAPIKDVKWTETPYLNTGMLVTASWDKTVKYWDLRSAAPLASVNLNERCYSMDVAFPLMVVATATQGEGAIQMFDLNKPGEVFSAMKSPLSLQTRVVTCFPGGNGFGVGSIEGRVAMHYIEDKDAQKNFSFRCHRKSDKPNPTSKDMNLVYAVNDINIHPVYGTFSTCGSDGTINYWDGDSRTRLKSLDPASGPISATCFNRSGSIQAYAISYDWHKGHVGMTPGLANKLMLHRCKEDEVKRKTR